MLEKHVRLATCAEWVVTTNWAFQGDSFSLPEPAASVMPTG